MTFKIEAGVDIPPGTYKAQLLGTEVIPEGTFKTPKNPTGTYRRWDWLVEVKGESVPFSDNTSLNTSPKTITYARLTALLGEAPKAGDELSDPTGKTVVLTFGKKDNGFPKIEQVGAYVDPQQTLEGLPR
jgi:hypothetical protein